MEIFKELNKKGYKHYYEGTIEELDLMDKSNPYLHSEIMQVVMWLYEKHKIWISVTCDCGNQNLFTYKVFSTKNWNEHCFYNGNNHQTPTEAYLKAIEYTLNNLI